MNDQCIGKFFVFQFRSFDEGSKLIMGFRPQEMPRFGGQRVLFATVRCFRPQ